ncbi:MAG: FixH family protein [Flavobacteriales bacterium]|nr:FixH family protein [Flavobacteriales bacterium]
MKLNWGTGIAIVMIGFMSFIVYMAVKASQKRVDLHVENYYEQELEYQDVIDAKQAAKRLHSSLNIQQDNEVFTIGLPEEHKHVEINGVVRFHRADNASLDFEERFEIEKGLITIDKERLLTGLYQIEVLWYLGEQSYFHEQAVQIIK